MSAGESDGVASVRDTVLARCIGARIVDITAVDTEEFKAGEPNLVYFHLDNGETLYATMGVDGEDLIGMLDMEAKDDSE